MAFGAMPHQILSFDTKLVSWLITLILLLWIICKRFKFLNLFRGDCIHLLLLILVKSTVLGFWNFILSCDFLNYIRQSNVTVMCLSLQIFELWLSGNDDLAQIFLSFGLPLVTAHAWNHSLVVCWLQRKNLEHRAILWWIWNLSRLAGRSVTTLERICRNKLRTVLNFSTTKVNIFNVFVLF